MKKLVFPLMVERIIGFYFCFLCIVGTGFGSNCYEEKIFEIQVRQPCQDTLRDYQVRLDLNDRNFDFSKVSGSGNYIRFFSSPNANPFTSNTDKVSYWIEDWDSLAQQATVWIKYPVLVNGNKNRLYAYYTDGSGCGFPLSNESNGEDVFLFFDDFNDNSFNSSKWSITQNTNGIGTVQEKNQRLELTQIESRQSVEVQGIPFSMCGQDSFSCATMEYKLVTRLFNTACRTAVSKGILYDADTSNNRYAGLQYEMWYGKVKLIDQSGSTTIGTTTDEKPRGVISADNEMGFSRNEYWGHWKEISNSAGPLQNFLDTVASGNFQSTCSANAGLQLEQRGASTSTCEQGIAFDDVLVRKCDCEVIVIQPVFADAGKDTAVCEGTCVTLGGAPTASGGTPPYSYKWSPATGLSSDEVANPEACPSATTAYIVTVTDSAGITDKDTVTVIVHNVPVAQARTDTVICQGTCVGIGGMPTATGGTAPYSYSWSPATRLNSDTASNPVACPDSTTTYTVTVTDAAGCSDTSKTAVFVRNPDVFSFNGDFELGDVPGTQGEIKKATSWSDASGNPDLFDSVLTCITDPCTSPIPDYNCVDVPCNFFGDEQVRLTGTKRYGGLLAVQLFDPADDFFKDWPKGTGISNIPQQIVETPPKKLVEAMQVDIGKPLDVSKTYRLSLYVSVAELYAGEATVVVKFSEDSVLNSLYRPVARKEFYRATFNDMSWIPVSFTFKPDKPYQYLIIESDMQPKVLGRVIPDTSEIPMDSTEIVEFLNSLSRFTIERNRITYFYVDDVSLEEECSPDTGLVVYAGPDDTICAGACILLGANQAVSGGVAPYTYAWSPVTGLSNPNIARPAACPAATTTYTLTVTDANGDTDSDDITITVNQNVPVADAGRDIAVCEGECVIIGGSPTASGGGGGYTYQWVPATGLDDAGTANPQACPDSTTEYTVITGSSNGCWDTDKVTVTVSSSTGMVLSNGDFEDATLPSGRGQIENATGWIKATGDADLFDVNYDCSLSGCPNTPADYNCVGIPCNHLGFQNIRSNGDRYAGLWSLTLLKADLSNLDGGAGLPKTVEKVINDVKNTADSIDTPDIQLVEGIEIELDKPMEPGRRYSLSFYVSLAECGEAGCTNSNLITLDQIEGGSVDVAPLSEVVVKFSRDSITSQAYQPVNRPAVYSSSVNNTSSWEQKTFTFTADSAYAYLIIESSAGSPLPTSTSEAYFYIDDITLEETCESNTGSAFITKEGKPEVNKSSDTEIILTTPSHASPMGAFRLYPNPTKGSFVLELPVSDPNNPVVIEIYDITGAEITRTIRPETLNRGLNIIRINLGDARPPGIYIIKVQSGEDTYTRRVSVVK